MTDESKWLKSRLYDMACASPKPECSVPYKAMKLIEELEATIDGQAYLAGKEYGRLQGLDEAIEFLRCRPQTPQMIALIESINALKEQSQ